MTDPDDTRRDLRAYDDGRSDRPGPRPEPERVVEWPTLDRVRALIAAEPALGSPSVAARLGIKEHAARKALRKLGHVGRRGPTPPAPITPDAWLMVSDLAGVLLAAGAALTARADRGHGLTAEECRDIGRALMVCASPPVGPCLLCGGAGEYEEVGGEPDEVRIVACTSCD